ncbi:MAG: hypothetical protein HC887_03105 [Desulfobacteraceae bacterium]|nr:hypothetical protein [Desulfobacteraceae bacterium]
MTDQELAEKDMAGIKKLLLNPTGKNNSNVKVMPNKSLRFMVIFSELPENPDEFTVEVANSSPSK